MPEISVIQLIAAYPTVIITSNLIGSMFAQNFYGAATNCAVSVPLRLVPVKQLEIMLDKGSFSRNAI